MRSNCSPDPLFNKAYFESIRTILVATQYAFSCEAHQNYAEVKGVIANPKGPHLNKVQDVHSAKLPKTIGKIGCLTGSMTLHCPCQADILIAQTTAEWHQLHIWSSSQSCRHCLDITILNWDKKAATSPMHYLLTIIELVYSSR
jgi:hypothetical protein